MLFASYYYSLLAACECFIFPFLPRFVSFIYWSRSGLTYQGGLFYLPHWMGWMAWAVPWFCFVYLSTSVVLKVSRDWVLPFFSFLYETFLGQGVSSISPHFLMDGFIRFFLSFSFPSLHLLKLHSGRFPLPLARFLLFSSLCYFSTKKRKRKKAREMSKKKEEKERTREKKTLWLSS